MSMTRYSSVGALHRNRDHSHFSTFDSSYSDDRHNAMYRSSPDLSHASLSHRRSSSTDSLDGTSSHHSSHGSHSRQSSDSTDVYPTRRYSAAQIARKPSTSADPLQFVKLKGGTELAHLAEEQIKAVSETKKIKFKVEKDEEYDWQSNLSSWKNRRKSQSERTYQMKEELEAAEREKEGREESKLPTKTFSQMQEDRERRKSHGRKFYPINDNDDGDDDAFAPATVTPQESSPSQNKHKTEETSALPPRRRANIPKWMEDTNDDAVKDKIDSTSPSEDANNNSSNNNNDSKARDRKLLRESKLSSKLREWEEEDSLIESSRSRRSGAPGFTSRRDARNNAQNDAHSSSAATTDAPKTQSKVGNILKSFQQKEESKPRTRPSGLEHKVDVSSRKKSFENFSDDSHASAVPSRLSRLSQQPEDSAWSSSSNNDKKSSPPSSLSSSGISSTVYTSSKENDLDFVLKNIKITQKANSDKGFGFFISGGSDKQKPLAVSKVTLGSAADICELKVKDEVIEVNRRDVTSLTDQEVGEMIATANASGQIELRIKRWLGNNDEEEFEDEDFTSSSDEGEAELNSPTRKEVPEQRQQPQDQINDQQVSMQNQLDEERQWLEDQIRGTNSAQSEAAPVQNFSVSYTLQVDQNGMREEDTRPPPAEEFTSRGVNSEQSTEPGNAVEVEIRPSITVKKQNVGSERPGNPQTVPTSTANSRVSDNAQDDDSDGSGHGPPAILRKWQRQRPKEEYTFESDTPAGFSHGRQSATLPRDMGGADRSRLREERGSKSQDDTTVGSRRAEIWRQTEEGGQSDVDTQRLLEERRAERRARLQQQAASAGATAAPSSQQQEQQQQQQQQQQQPNIHVSSMTVRIPNPSEQPLGQPSMFIIDPRNRQPQGDVAEGAVQFQVNLAPASSVQDTEAMIEAERERIRQEEMRRVEEERKRKEEEELRKIREKEEQLRQQEEMLRQQQEQLRREQEEFRKIKEQQQQQQLQQDQIEQQHHQPVQHSQPPYHQRPQPSQQPVEFEAITSRVREGSPSYTSTVIPSSRGSARSGPQPARNPPSNAYPHQGHQRSEHTWISRPQESQASKPSWRSEASPRVSSGHSGLPKWPPAKNEDTPSNVDSRGSRKFSREDMLAMNRKATPMQQSPPPMSPQEPADVHSRTSPIIREAPSKGQIHSLNSVPRAKIRDPNQWIGHASAATGPTGNQSPPWQDSQRMPGPYRSQPPGDHWLIQEAERRRIAEREGRAHHSRAAQQGGPIRPANDLGNRWRDGDPSEGQGSGVNGRSMPAAIRQTLLQKTAGARGSNGSNYSQELTPSHSPYSSMSPSSPGLSSTLPSNFSYDPHHHHQQQQQQQNYGPPDHLPPPPGENGHGVSGSQLCSHCGHELGFGAAMVIESLGLYYHVQCFRCCVCHASLGSGQHGADVRVRVNKLHCPNCYSNDEEP